MELSEAFDMADDGSEELANMLSDLIRIDTSVPPGRGYADMVDYLQPRLEEAGLECERVCVPRERWDRTSLPLEGERVNLAARLQNGRQPLTIYAHMDVVPPGSGWSVPPFGGIIREGKVYGRGALDMKGSIPPLIIALRIMREAGLESSYDVTVCLTTDEEIGTDTGAVYLAEKGYFRPPIINLEGGGQGPAMIEANSGMLKATVTVTGREAHSGISFTGINALEESLPVIEELIELKKSVESKESTFAALPLPGSPSEKLTPTFNLNMMSAGEKINVVPGVATLQIDRRFTPEENLEDVKAEIMEAVERAKRRSRALSIEVEFERIYPPLRIDPRSPHVERWCEGMRIVLGYPPETPFFFFAVNGATDMSFVSEIVGTSEFIGAGVIDAAHFAAHGADECVPVQNLVNLCKELIYFLAAPPLS